MEIYKVGDIAIYNGKQAKIIDTNIEEGKEYKSTYKIEIYTNCQQRFWVHNKQLIRAGTSVVV